MVDSGCPALQYVLKTSPATLPGGATVTFSGSQPSITVNQGTNIDPFAVSITHEDASNGDVYAYTAFMINPVDPDPASADYVTYCSTYGSSACLCSGSCAASVADFCSTDFHLEPVAQPTGLEYVIRNPVVPVTFSASPLNQFTLPSSQPDFGCQRDSYAVLVEDPASPGSFISSSEITLDTSTMELTLSLSDAAYAGDTTFRLAFNGQNFADFTVSVCALPLAASIFSAGAAQQLKFAKKATTSETDSIVFSDYSYVGGSTCGGYAATVNFVTAESWIAVDTIPAAPALTLTTSDSGVTDTADFPIDFQVVDHFNDQVVTETITVTVIECSSETGSGLAFDEDGPAIADGVQADTFEWNVTFKTSYTLTLMPTVHDEDAVCGPLNGQVVVTTNDPLQTFSSYTVESAGPPLSFDFTLDSGTRPMTNRDETITIEISDSNPFGATVTTTLTINLHDCSAAPDPYPAHLCRFYMNEETGDCVFPENTNMHASCGSPLNFEIADAVGSSTFLSVGASQVNWATQTGDGAAHTLQYDFSAYSFALMQTMIGVYDAQRHQSTITETFQVVLCLFTEPVDIYATPADDVFEYNRSKNGGAQQQFDIDLNLYDMSTYVSECQNYVYDLVDAQSWTQLILSGSQSSPNILRVTIDGTTPTGEVTVQYMIQSTDTAYTRLHDITLKVVDCNELGHDFGTNFFYQHSSATNGDYFQQNQRDTLTYSHEELYWGEDTICAAIDYTLTAVSIGDTPPTVFATTFGSAAPSVYYSTNVWETREIIVNMDGWDRPDMFKEILITITGDNTANDPNFTGFFTEELTIQILDCRFEVMSTIPSWDSVFVLAGETVQHTFDSSGITTSEPGCYPLTLSMTVEGPTNTWTVIESGVYVPSWVTSVTQGDDGAATPTFNYSFDLEMALTSPMPSFTVKNHVVNVDGGPVTKESTSYQIHFFAADLLNASGDIWVNSGFIFTKLQSDPTVISTYKEYDTRNPLVELKVFFTRYDNTYGIYSKSSTASTMDLNIDMAQMPLPGPFIDNSVRRSVKVVDIATSDSVWVQQLREVIQVELYDCAYDFPTPLSNLELIQGEETNPNFEDPKFRYQIDLGDVFLPVLVQGQQWESVCGTQVVELTLVDPAYAIYISYDPVTSQIDIIDDPAVSDISPFLAEAYFTVKNDEYEVVLNSTPFFIEKFNCHTTTYTNMPDSSTITIDLASIVAADWPQVWDTMVFDDSLCTVEHYKVTCVDPAGVTHTVLPGTSASAICNVFTADTTLGEQKIDIDDWSAVQNSHEGIYTFTVEGYNGLSPANFGTYTLTVTILPNCQVATIANPAQFAFSYTTGDAPFIVIDVFKSNSWSLSGFQLSTTTLCEMTLHLMHSPDGTQASYSEVLPDYISMALASSSNLQPFTIAIDGTKTSNEQFTGVDDKVEFAVEARIVDTNPVVSTVTEFDLVFIRDCSASKIMIQETIALPTQTVRLGLIDPTEITLISSDDTALTSAIIYNIADVNYDESVNNDHDRAACAIDDSMYHKEIEAQTTNILSLSVATATDLIEVSTRTDLKNADVVSTSTTCDLSVLGQFDCAIDYKIEIQSYNDTFVLATGQVVFENECLSLKQLYEDYGNDLFTHSDGNDYEMWHWPQANLDDFNMGYALRQDKVSFFLPQVQPKLNSNLSVQSQCGDMINTVDNPDYEVFTIDSTTTGNGNDPIKVEAETSDSSKILPMTEVFQGYTFQVSVQLENFKTHSDAVTYQYYAPTEYARKDQLTFQLRDYCRTARFTDTEIVIPDDSTVYDYQPDPTLGTLMIEKKILSSETEFFLKYIDYETDEFALTGVKYPCGDPDNDEKIIYETQPVSEDNEIFEDVVTQSNNEALWLTTDGLKYTIQPLYTEQAHRAFYFEVKATVPFPIEAVERTDIGTTTMRVFIKIKPCEVLEIVQANQFQDYALTIGQDSHLIEFNNYQQIPRCNYTMTYNLTVVRDVPNNIDDLVIGERQDAPPVATFSSELRSIGLYSDYSAYDKTEFIFFITGHADIDLDLQDPIFGINSGFKVEFNLTPPDPPDQDPSIANYMSKFEVRAGTKETITIGQPYDYQMRKIDITWKYQSATQTFIEMVGITDQQPYLKFDVSPPATTTPKTVKIQVLLSVKDTEFKKTFSIQIAILEPYQAPDIVVTGEFEVKEKVVKRKPIAVTFKVGKVDSNGYLKISASQEVYWPDDIANWTSENFGISSKSKNYVDNVGSQFIKVSYDASGETLDYLENNEIEPIGVEYKVANKTKTTLTLKLDFSDPTLVSKFYRKGYIDRVQVEFTDKWLTDLAVTVVNQKEKLKAKVMPQRKEETFTAATLNFAQGSMAAFFGVNFVTSALQAQLIQYLWGIINSLQLIVLTVLYSLEIPELCYDILIRIMKLTNLDLIDVEWIFDELFAFRETEPINTTFEQAGYESSNFFHEMGPLLFLIVFYILYMPIRKAIQWFGSQTKGKNCCTRRMRSSTDFKMTIVRFLFESCVELGLAVLICLTRVSRDNFAAPWEAFATGCAIFLGLILFLYPFYLMRAKKLYLKQIAQGVKDSWYQFLFPDLKKKSESLDYSTIFFVRRYFMVLSICLPPQNEIIQTFVHILVCVAYVAYFASVKPFDRPAQNLQEILNEFGVTLASYHLLIFNQWAPDDKSKEYTGYSLLSIVALTVALNVLLIIVIVTKKCILRCKIRRAKKAAQKRKEALEDARRLKEQANAEQQQVQPKLVEAKFKDAAPRDVALQQVALTATPTTTTMTQVKSKAKASARKLQKPTKVIKQPAQKLKVNDVSLSDVAKLLKEDISTPNQGKPAKVPELQAAPKEKPKAPEKKNPFELSAVNQDLFNFITPPRNNFPYAKDTTDIKKFDDDYVGSAVQAQIDHFDSFWNNRNIQLRQAKADKQKNTQAAAAQLKDQQQSVATADENQQESHGQGKKRKQPPQKKHKLDLSMIGKSLMQPGPVGAMLPSAEATQNVAEQQSYPPIINNQDDFISVPKLNLNFNLPQQHSSGNLSSLRMESSAKSSAHPSPPPLMRPAKQLSLNQAPSQAQNNRFELSPVKMSLFGMQGIQSAISAKPHRNLSLQQDYPMGETLVPSQIQPQKEPSETGAQTATNHRRRPKPRASNKPYIQLTPMKPFGVSVGGNNDPVQPPPQLQHRNSEYSGQDYQGFGSRVNSLQQQQANRQYFE